MLAGRLSSGAMSDFSSTGTIKLNGKEYDSSLASLVAFVEQASPSPSLVRRLNSDALPVAFAQ